MYLVPKHVCPTVNLADTALWVEEDGEETVECHRVNIHARAHPLLIDDAPIDVVALDQYFWSVYSNQINQQQINNPGTVGSGPGSKL